MSDPSRKSPDPLVILWAVVALGLMAVVAWASMQVDDPLSAYVRTDKMQHIIGFGALGLCAAFMPSAGWRLRGLAAVMTLAILVELVQIPIPDRTASLSDLAASFIGGFAGFGLGAAATSAFALARSRISSRS